MFASDLKQLVDGLESLAATINECALPTTTTDLFFWALITWGVVRALRDGGRVWLLLGAVCGIALENKMLPAALLAALPHALVTFLAVRMPAFLTRLAHALAAALVLGLRVGPGVRTGAALGVLLRVGAAAGAYVGTAARLRHGQARARHKRCGGCRRQ